VEGKKGNPTKRNPDIKQNSRGMTHPKTCEGGTVQRGDVIRPKKRNRISRDDERNSMLLNLKKKVGSTPAEENPLGRSETGVMEGREKIRGKLLYRKIALGKGKSNFVTGPVTGIKGGKVSIGFRGQWEREKEEAMTLPRL